MTNIEIGGIPDDHMIVGYLAQMKVIDPDGKSYYAMRYKDLNDMECYGMANDLVDCIRTDLQASKYIQD